MRIDDVIGKVCLITGASRGIGAAAARGLAAAGMRIGAHYRSGAAEAKAVAADIAATGREAFLLHGDIAEPGTMDRLVQETVGHFGRLDVLINNAGDLIERHPAAETSDELFDRQVAINMRPVFTGCRAAVGNFVPRPAVASSSISVPWRRGPAAADRHLRSRQGVCCHVHARTGQGSGRRGHPGQRRIPGRNRNADAGPHDVGGSPGSCTPDDPDGAHRDG